MIQLAGERCTNASSQQKGKFANSLSYHGSSEAELSRTPRARSGVGRHGTGDHPIGSLEPLTYIRLHVTFHWNPKVFGHVGDWPRLCRIWTRRSVASDSPQTPQVTNFFFYRFLNFFSSSTSSTCATSHVIGH